MSIRPFWATYGPCLGGEKDLYSITSNTVAELQENFKTPQEYEDKCPVFWRIL